MAHIQAIKGIATQKIELGGRVRVIKYDLNAYGELENRYGSVEKAMDELRTGNIKALRMILWAGLIHEEAIVDEITGEPTGYRITPFEVGSWVLPGQIPEISQKITTAITETLPQDVQEQAKKEIQEAMQIQEQANTKIATVVYTEEEKAAKLEEEKEKNG